MDGNMLGDCGGSQSVFKPVMSQVVVGNKREQSEKGQLDLNSEVASLVSYQSKRKRICYTHEN